MAEQQKQASLDELKVMLDKKAKEAEDYLSHLKRLQADFENFIKRSSKEREEVVAYASERIVLKLLTILDEFEHALTGIRNAGTKEELLKGIELLYNNFHKVLQDEGVQLIESVGKKSDPFQHEVILTESRDGIDDGMIIEEIQKGYRMKDKVIRYAK